MTALSIVLGYRDRGVDRVRRCLDSLAGQTVRDFEVLLVDSGSIPATGEAVRRAVEGHPFGRWLYSETRGRPWNRSHALNVGIRRASGEYLMTSDVDMVFPPDFLAHALERCTPQRVLYCAHHFLPRGFADWERLSTYRDRLPVAPRTAFGACQIAPRTVVAGLGGFDEFYRYWGVEDRDMNRRLLGAGLEESWINDETAIFHQWHPPADLKTPGFFPGGLWGRMERHYLERRDEVVRNGEDWGRPLSAAERPVLGFLDLERGTLLDRRELHRIAPSPYQQQSIASVLRTFWDLPRGEALAVAGAALPHRFAPLDALLGVTNRLLRWTGHDTEAGYRPNVLHSFLAELVHPPPGEVADYYLDLPDGTGWSLLLRAGG